MEIFEEDETKVELEGQAEAFRKIILMQGSKRFGEPGEETFSKLNEIGSVERLEGLTVLLLDAPTWEELLK